MKAVSSTNDLITTSKTQTVILKQILDQEFAPYGASRITTTGGPIVLSANAGRGFALIAHELVTSLKGSVTVDWMHREAARARMRVLVKRLLRKYGYPPDLQDTAVQNVLQQAEALSAAWAA